MIQNITQEINILYNRWLTSIDPIASYRSGKKCREKLKIYTSNILYNVSYDLLPYLDEIYSEMLEKIYYSQMNNKINTLDYFCSWYSKSLINHIVNFHKYLNRKKRVMILYEYQLCKDISEIEVSLSMHIYHTNQQQQEVAEIINTIFPLEPDNSLFYDRHVLGISVEELALDYDTTVDGVKSRLKRAKKRLNVASRRSKYN